MKRGSISPYRKCNCPSSIGCVPVTNFSGHPIDRSAFPLAYRQMRIGEPAGVEQIRRERDVQGFFRFAVDVWIAKQAFLLPAGDP